MMLVLLLGYGIRPEEFLQILPKDVDLKRGAICVPERVTKSRLERTVGISRPTVNALNRVMSARHSLWEEDVPVFCSRY